LRQDEGLIIYPCSICQHLHVGHSNMKKKPVVYALWWERKKVRLERKIAAVQQQLAQLQLNLQRLLASPPRPDKVKPPRQGAQSTVTKGALQAPLYLTESTEPETLVFAVPKGMALEPATGMDAIRSIEQAGSTACPLTPADRL